jgi:glycine/D-amino acid oxidase-like deaminating enzyme
VKYALGGRATEASRAVADVQSTWRACLRGERAPDLRTVRIAAHHMHMWTAGAGSKLAAWGAKRALRSGVRKLTERPPAFDGAPKSVAVYEVDESLIDPASLIAALADAARAPLIRARTLAIAPAIKPHDLTTIETDAGRLEARRVILAAGAGNESLLTLAGIDPAPLSQRRPLHMVVVRGAPFELWGHCLQVSEVPRLTITTSHDAGDIVWYIGGGIAEDGVDRTDEAQIDAAKEELRACLPWADLTSTKGGVKWGTLRVDRAEGKSPAGKRPDSVVIHNVQGEAGPVIAVWPTKLVLAPLAAQRIADLLASDDKLPAPAPVAAPSPPIALAPWESEGFRWS